MWKRLILLEYTKKWDFKFKTIHLPSKSLLKFEIMIAFVNVVIDYNPMQNNSNVRRIVTSKWHLFVGRYLGSQNTQPMQIPTHVSGTGVKAPSPPLPAAGSCACHLLHPSSVSWPSRSLSPKVGWPQEEVD